MRYSRYQTSRPPRRSGNKSFTIALLVIIGGMLVYFAGAGALGTFISSNIVNPVVAFFSGEQAAAPVASTEPTPTVSLGGDTVTEKITVEGKTIYTIQAGVFTDQNNATALAKSVQQQGGAGYVKPDGNYRVLLSAYKTEEEAKSVKQKLLSQNKMQTSIYEMGYETVTFEVTAPKDVVSLIHTAMSSATEMLEKIYDLSLQLDKKEITLEKAKSETANLLTEAVQLRDSMDAVQTASENSIASGLFSLYTGFAECLSEISKGNITEVEFSASIKQIYLNIFDKIDGLMEAL